MGRGRAKAKQTKVARELKYNSGSTDLDRLRQELVGSASTDDERAGVGHNGGDGADAAGDTDDTDYQADDYADPYADLYDDGEDEGDDGGERSGGRSA